MIDDDFPEAPARGPLWLITLADLALLLVGFFVLIQATQTIDRKVLVNGIRDGFGAPALSPPSTPDPMPVAATVATGFAPGSAALLALRADIVAWAHEALADPRVTIRIAGMTDGSTADVDPATGSAALLAADRARAVAGALAGAGIKAAGRITIVNATGGGRRGVTLTQGFVGDRP